MSGRDPDYSIDLSKFKPDDEMSEKERDLVRMLVKLGINVLVFCNDKMSKQLIEMEDQQMLDDMEGGGDDYEAIEEGVGRLHALTFKIHKFCQHLAVTYLKEDQDPQGLLQELQDKAPVAPDDGSDSDMYWTDSEGDTWSSFGEEDFLGAVATDEEPDWYYRSDDDAQAE